MNSGGSPSGDSAPPMLPTSKTKNTTAWMRCRRPSLPASNGRMSNIDAPAVPMKLASAAPSASSAVLRTGVPATWPWTQMPPAMVYNANRTTTNGRYSSSNACTTSCSAVAVPNRRTIGARSTAIHAADTFPKWACHHLLLTIGISAMESSKPAKGIPQIRESCAGSKATSDGTTNALGNRRPAPTQGLPALPLLPLPLRLRPFARIGI